MDGNYVLKPSDSYLEKGERRKKDKQRYGGQKREIGKHFFLFGNKRRAFITKGTKLIGKYLKQCFGSGPGRIRIIL